jgi:hypothetical protein
LKRHGQRIIFVGSLHGQQSFVIAKHYPGVRQ